MYIHLYDPSQTPDSSRGALLNSYLSFTPQGATISNDSLFIGGDPNQPHGCGSFRRIFVAGGYSDYISGPYVFSTGLGNPFDFRNYEFIIKGMNTSLSSNSQREVVRRLTLGLELHIPFHLAATIIMMIKMILNGKEYKSALSRNLTRWLYRVSTKG